VAAAPGSPRDGGEGRNELSLVRSPDEADASTGIEIGQRQEPVFLKERKYAAVFALVTIFNNIYVESY